MPAGNDGLQPINCFALVTYIPDSLGAFLDDLRRELVPDCVPRAHVTILPPRPVDGPTESAVQVLGARIADFPAFEVEPRGIEVFETTSVIYLEIGAGHAELNRMHRVLNTGPLAFDEPFPYHPHVTIAQDLRPEQVSAFHEKANRIWQAYSGTRRFSIESLTFVQNTVQNRWLDLAHWSLGAVSIPR